MFPLVENRLSFLTPEREFPTYIAWLRVDTKYVATEDRSGLKQSGILFTRIEAVTLNKFLSFQLCL